MGNPTELKIRCGEWDTQHQTEPYQHQDQDVQSLAIHPEFDGRNLQNDFAVLFTSEDFILDQHIDTACLPAADETTTHSMVTPAMCVEPGTKTKLQISHRRLRLVADLVRSSRT